jgi:hypothetical protein
MMTTKGEGVGLTREASSSARDYVSFLFDKFVGRKHWWQLYCNVKHHLAQFDSKERRKQLLQTAFILFLGV